MRWRSSVLIGALFAGLLYVAAPQPASALPGAPRADAAGSQAANPVEQVGRRGWRHRGYGYRRYGYGYRGYGYRRYGYSNPYYYDGGYYPYYRRRPGFGIYLGF
jgi:hypothetical protein